MTKIMTPSLTEMTDGQIDKAVELYRAMLRKHRSELGSEPVQQVLGQPEFVGEMVGLLCKRAEAVSNLIVRRVKVDRTNTPQQVLDATGRRQYVDADVVKSMPKGEGDEGNVFFFKPRPEAYDESGSISDDNLEGEFEFHGLKPCDPYKLAQVNTDDPAFADKRPNATHWKDANGKWCYTAFSCWYVERGVSVRRGGSGWVDSWWFAGLRK